MTPDKRLNQLEPVVADVVQKVDRLIEGNGQIIHEVSKIPGIEKNVSTIATGLAELTITVNQQFAAVDQRFEQQQQQIDSRFAAVDQRFEQQQQQIDSRFDAVDQRFEEQQQQIDDRFTQQQRQINSLREEMQQGFQKIDQRFDQIVTLIQDRLM